MNACGSCGFGNIATARFCIECGAPLARTCPGCATDVTASQKFCAECGHHLRGSGGPAVRPVESERKQVTVLFADVAGSMDLAERFDPDDWTQIITGLFAVAAEAVQRFGGTVDKFTGDGLMALFGAPVAQEDHAARAAHAALALVTAAREYALKAAAEHGAGLHVRVGLNSGEVVAGDVADSGFTVVGHAVGLAQRMESLAEPDTIRVSEPTARLLGTGFVLRDLGLASVKGATAPVRSFGLDAVTAGPRRRSGAARLVGRDAEWATLAAALDAAQDGQAQVVGIVGEAGAGKSRLTEELARLAAGRSILVRRTAGVSHATSAPLLPIRALFADYFDVLETDSAVEVRAKVADRTLHLDADLDTELPLIFDFLDVPDPDRPAPPLSPGVRRTRVLEVLRRLTRRRSAQLCMVLLLEDLHWFDEHSVEFLDEWLPSFPGTRTLIVTNFRPEFSPPWAHRSYYRQIPLAGLDGEAVAAMVTDLVGTDASLHGIGDQLAGWAGGNPFFVEEIVRGWVEDGTLRGSAGAYVLAHPVDAVVVPASVQSVLADRIDRLGILSKGMLQAAAVIGRTFSRPVLSAVTGVEHDDLDRALTELCAAEMLQEHDEGEYRFWHPLTQEVAYNSLLGATRRRHHRAVAEALLSTSPGRHDELAALVAFHFEAAEEHLDAARWHVRTAARESHVDVQAALRRLRAGVRHTERVPEDRDAGAVGIRARCLLLRVGGRAGLDPDEAEMHARAARQAAEDLDDPVALTHLEMATGIFRYFTGSHAGAHAAFSEARRHADATGDHDLRAWSYGVGSIAHATVGPLREGLALLDRVRALRRPDPVGDARPSSGRPELALPSAAEVDDTLHLLGASIELGAGDLDSVRLRILAGREAFALRPVSDWLVWTLTLLSELADRTGIEADITVAREALHAAHQLADDSGSFLAKVRAWQSTAIVALLDERAEDAVSALTSALELARSTRAGLGEEASLLVHLTRALHMTGAVDRARDTAGQAISIAHRQGARVVECRAHLARAQLVRETGDLPAARAAVGQGLALAEAADATTWAAPLVEEQTRLDGGDLASVAAGYDAIGAAGHAARIRVELARM